MLNYSQKMLSMFGIDITEKINGAYITLITNDIEFNEMDLLGKYGKNIFEKYLKTKKRNKSNS